MSSSKPRSSSLPCKKIDCRQSPPNRDDEITTSAPYWWVVAIKKRPLSCNCSTSHNISMLSSYFFVDYYTRHTSKPSLNRKCFVTFVSCVRNNFIMRNYVSHKQVLKSIMARFLKTCCSSLLKLITQQKRTRLQYITKM